MNGSLCIQHCGVELQLLPQRAVWLEKSKTLIVADVHLGKGTAFRAMGVPVPTGSSAKDLQQLSDLLLATRAERLIILGDMIHGRRSHQPQLLAALESWRHLHDPIEMVLIRGNHDRGAGRLPAGLNIREIDGDMEEGGLLLRHEPNASEAFVPVLAGHLHPVIAIRDFDRSTVSLPCFVFDPRGVGILPSFGSFTGSYRVSQEEGGRYYACAAGKVLEIK